ncbi:MAG: amidase domain-containing protein [Clostridia bacterium]|nr:amidase domain-containing protein [Clostridia bacterium]
MLEYNREKAVEYAKKYALKYNPAYFHFDGIGGDCTNFISQCLLAGGGKMNYDKYYGWFYIDKNNRSPSWSSVKYLQRFLLSNLSPGFKTKVMPIDKLQLGDIIQIRQNPDTFNHTVIITKITNREIYVCAHSYDALDKPLSSYNYLELKGLHIVDINIK